MSLTKRRAKKYINMLKEGISLQIVLMMFITSAKNEEESSRFINEYFYIIPKGESKNAKTKREHD